jgi:hypothetical protein
MNRERGEGRIGLIIALLLVAAFIYVGIKVIPLKVSLFTLSDKIEQKLQRSSWRSYEQARAETLNFVKEEAEATGYPTDKLKISMPNPAGGQMIILVDWQIPVDLAVTEYVWNFHLEKRAPMLGRGGSAY